MATLIISNFPNWKNVDIRSYFNNYVGNSNFCIFNTKTIEVPFKFGLEAKLPKQINKNHILFKQVFKQVYEPQNVMDMNREKYEPEDQKDIDEAKVSSGWSKGNNNDIKKIKSVKENNYFGIFSPPAPVVIHHPRKTTHEKLKERISFLERQLKKKDKQIKVIQNQNLSNLLVMKNELNTEIDNLKKQLKMKNTLIETLKRKKWENK